MKDRRLRMERIMVAMIAVAQLALPTAAPGSAGDDRAWLIRTFDEMAANVVPAATTRPADNDSGRIAWGDSYTMSALAEMLAATGDAKYADMFVRLADHVLEARDSLRKRLDEYRGMVAPAWGSGKYSDGKWHVWAVHTGMICEPLARFAGIVRKDARLKERYAGKADQYLAAAQAAVAVHESDYRAGPGKDEGHLYGHVNQIHLPLNMQNALARAWIYIDDATGKPEHREHIEKLACFFKNRIRVEADGALAWEYRPPLDGPGTKFEDVSHGSINADFLVVCYERGIVFNKQDIEGLATTLLTRVIRPDGSIASNVGGTGKVNEHRAQALRWARLARHCDPVRRRLVELRRAGSFGGAGTDMLGCALLTAACRSTPTTRSGDIESLGPPGRATQALAAGWTPLSTTPRVRFPSPK